MKRSLLALAVSTVFLLSACNEKETQALNQKLQQAEQTIATLNQDLANAQQKLTAYQAQVPALQVEIEPLFVKSETITYPKQDEYSPTEAKISFFVSSIKTQFDWLDNLLVRQILNNSQANQNSNRLTGNEKAELVAMFEKNYQETLSTLKKEPEIGYSNTVETTYVGQRNNILTFSQFYYSYSGGAHGVYNTQFIVVDANKKAVLTLDDLMTPANQTKVRELLWEQYVGQQSLDENGKTIEPFASKTDFRLSSNFYFDEKGISFVYPIYELASYAEGEQTLTLPWFEANKFIPTEYQRGKKDWVGLLDITDM